MAEVRVAYVQQIQQMRQRIRAAVQSGELSPEKGFGVASRLIQAGAAARANRQDERRRKRGAIVRLLGEPLEGGVAVPLEDVNGLLLCRAGG